MGVTVHFKGRLRDADALDEVIRLAQMFADERGWPSEPVEEPQVRLRRVEGKEACDYAGPVKGLALYPHENSEPVRLEFDKDLCVQEYTKTQFAPVDCHKSLVALLQQLAPYFEEFQVEDEGGFYGTGDAAQLQSSLDRCFEVLDEYLANRGRYHGPVRLESGRIVDVMERD